MSGLVETPVAVDDGVRVLGRGVIIGVDDSGPFLPGAWGDETIPLDVAGLQLLRLLSRGPADPTVAADRIAHRNKVDARSMLDLVSHLAQRGLLSAPAPEAAVQPPTANVSESGTPPAVDPDLALVLPNPVLLLVTPDGFTWWNHDLSKSIQLDARQVIALSAFITSGTIADVAVRQTLPEPLSPAMFEALARRAFAATLLSRFDPDDPAASNAAKASARANDDVRRHLHVKRAFELRNQEFEEEESERTARIGRARVPVIGVNSRWNLPPLSIGLLLAYAQAYRDGVLEDRYAFHPSLLQDPPDIAALAARPSVFLFSNYLWCTPENLALSAIVKQVDPRNITIHGGPNTPKYPGDLERFFEENPHVDIAVHGEGEATLAEALDALAGHLDDVTDLSVLDGVPGLSYRSSGGVVRTGDRDRIEDLDTIPSPILTGMFDSFTAAGPSAFLIVETNRGCPYGCTFCDWGSATLSRIRKFDLDRVFAELEWSAKVQMNYVVIADANFGIFERDVDIARKVAELRSEHGAPVTVGTNYAKNTVKHLSKIIDIFAGAGIVAEGKVSLQTMDEETLTVIKRKNIKVEKYNDLSVEFRKNDLPLSVELMMGLPGSSPVSFRQDLQECINRDVRTMVYPTVLLPNSPMNDPAYRERHQIVALPGERVMQSDTFTLADWRRMERLTQVFLLCDMFGVLRQVSTFVRQAAGIREIDFYERLLDASLDDRERYPTVAFTFGVVPTYMVPPVSWQLFLDEVHAFLVDDLGIPDDSGLAATLTMQRALLPSRERVMPASVELDHDFAAWHRAVLDARETGHRDDWMDVVPPLGSFGSTTMRIEDPHDVCSGGMSSVLASLSVQGGYWEFGCSVSRPVVAEVG